MEFPHCPCRPLNEARQTPRRKLGTLAHPLPHLLQPLPAALDGKLQRSRFAGRLVHLTARRYRMRLFAGRDLFAFGAALGAAEA